jgi:hypothetical protein
MALGNISQSELSGITEGGAEDSLLGLLLLLAASECDEKENDDAKLGSADSNRKRTQ